MKVLVIPEDFTHDQFILKPIIQAMMSNVGKPHAKIIVCHDPKLESVEQAMNWSQIEAIIQKYALINLFLLCVDRDGREGRRQALDNLEQRASEILSANRLFLATAARQEIETWLLAEMSDLPVDWQWTDIQNERDVKEAYFARQRGLLDALSQGRKILGKEVAGRYGRIRQMCPEVAQLENRIGNWMAANT
ncbi:MAG: hypothetical protein GY796_35545 [Chloroflexi bacterium]|nr:hypothetical protein [Chloroflexota bacterium]